MALVHDRIEINEFASFLQHQTNLDSNVGSLSRSSISGLGIRTPVLRGLSFCSAFFFTGFCFGVFTFFGVTAFLGVVDFLFPLFLFVGEGVVDICSELRVRLAGGSSSSSSFSS
jgi:hypothetical protein